MKHFDPKPDGPVADARLALSANQSTAGCTPSRFLRAILKDPGKRPVLLPVSAIWQSPFRPQTSESLNNHTDMIPVKLAAKNVSTQFRTAIYAVILIAALPAFAQTPGTKLWEFATGGEIYSSPAIADDGTIYFGSADKKLYALNPNGIKQWEFATAGPVYADPAIGPDGTIYIGSDDGQLYAVARDGQRLWEFPTGAPVTRPPAVGSDGSVYLTSADGNLYAISSNGSKKWQFSTGYDAPSPTLATDGAVYAGHYRGSSSYSLYALEPSGTVRWVCDYSGGFKLRLFCVVDFDGRIYPGVSEAYRLNPDGSVDTGFRQGFNNHPPTIGLGGRVYYTETQEVGARSATGNTLWSKELNYYPTAIALAEDGTIYVGSAKLTDASLAKRLYAIDGSDGANKWVFLTGGDIYAAPTIGTNGIVYVGSTDKKLYAVKGTGGPAKTAWPLHCRDLRHTSAMPRAALDDTQLAIRMYPGLTINGNIGSTYRVEYSDRIEGLDNWSMLATVTLDRTPYLFFDMGAAEASKRFYRAILLP